MGQRGRHSMAVRYVWSVLEGKLGVYLVLSKNRKTAISNVIHAHQEREYAAVSWHYGSQ